MTEETAQQPEPGPEPAPEPEPPPQPAAPPPRRLRRSRDDRVIAGVCGGIAEFFGIDATLVRIAAVLLVFAGGAGLLLYVIGWLVMPEETAGEAAAGAAAPARGGDHATRTAFGVILIVLGIAFLLDELDWLETRYLWPVALILVGLAVLARARR